LAADWAQSHPELDVLDTAVVRLDDSGRIRFMNSAAENGLLVSRDRARDRYLGEVVEIPPELRDAILEMPEHSPGLRLHELRLGRGLFDCSLKRMDDGDLLLELHDLEWEQMRHRLQQREVQTGMLALLSRNLGHEVRNPLGGIRGAAQLLADEVESHDLVTLARLIMREADRIDELILRFGQPELRRERLDLYPMLDEALDLLRAEFAGTVAIERDFDPSIPPLRCDATALRQVILNLLRNACQAGATVLLIRTRVEHGSGLLQSGQGSAIRLDVVDNGQGVPESLRSLLFLPLVTSRRSGSGLGLALSQQIASAHGGLLSFEPLAQGSQFSLFLPLANGEDEPRRESGQ
jgi:two-component system nitrogen regulation sensor histidine kinase GlnL